MYTPLKIYVLNLRSLILLIFILLYVQRCTHLHAAAWHLDLPHITHPALQVPVVTHTPTPTPEAAAKFQRIQKCQQLTMYKVLRSTEREQQRAHGRADAQRCQQPRSCHFCTA
jgi:hypothetical protein